MSLVMDFVGSCRSFPVSPTFRLVKIPRGGASRICPGTASWRCFSCGGDIAQPHYQKPPRAYDNRLPTRNDPRDSPHPKPVSKGRPSRDANRKRTRKTVRRGGGLVFAYEILHR